MSAPKIITADDMPKYNGLEKCEWKLGGRNTGLPCPHQSFPIHKRPSGPAKSVLEFIGDTPLVRLERLEKKYDLPCELYAKCEFFNAGGSIKDRIGLRMIEEAERSGRLKPGDTIIEPTSGNTGVGLCVAAAIKGYQVVITLPEKMSNEKVAMIQALGAKVIRSPDDAPWNSPESHIGLAIKLNKEIPNSHILDQYKNPANPLAHYEGTGAEILKQMDHKVDAIVIAAGTGGTLTGIARKIKDSLPQCRVVAVDPVGSILAQPDSLNDYKRLQGYHVEGIGYDFIPTVLDRSVVDEWVKIDDPEALQCARDLIRYEAFVCGGSSGTNLAGALKWIRSQPRESLVGKRVVTVMPDSSRNYMSKFLDDNWMMDKGFMSYDDAPQAKQVWSHQSIDPLITTQCSNIHVNATIGDVVDSLSSGVESPVVDSSGVIVGGLSESLLLNALSQGKASLVSRVSTLMNKKPKTISHECPVGHAAKMMELHASVIVIDSEKRPLGIVKRRDVLKYVASNLNAKENNKPSSQATSP